VALIYIAITAGLR